MQVFTTANAEINGEFYIWYFRGREVDAFRSQSAAEATVRRQFPRGWSQDYIFDSDGMFQFLGLNTDHRITRETRDAVTGI